MAQPSIPRRENPCLSGARIDLFSVSLRTMSAAKLFGNAADILNICVFYVKV